MVDTITYRTNDSTRWGNGQGADLSARQIDINFWALFSMLSALQDHAATGGIQSISVSGNNMFVTLTDGAVMGPFTLPTAQWNFRGAWLPATRYSPMDVVTNAGGIYLVLLAHTSAATFNPNANDGAGHDFYQLLLGPGPYDVGMYFPDRIPDDSSVLLVHAAARSFWLPAGLTSSVAILRVAASEELSFPLYKNDTLIGAILFGGITDSGGGADVQSDGSEIGTFAFTAAVQFNYGDRLIIGAPAPASAGPDATAQGLAVTLAGNVGIFAA